MSALDEEAADFTALAELAESFMALVETLMDGDAPAGMSPERIVEVAANCLPAGRHIALVIAEDDHSRTLAGTSDVPAQLEKLRSELGEGPALDVLGTNDLLVSNDLAGDARWPKFGPAAVDRLGIRSAVAYRLYIAPRLRAGLVLYSDWPHAFNDLDIATGSIFAAYCSLIVLTDHALGDRVVLRRATEVHREIGIAAGLLMAHEDIGIVDAYRRLIMAGRNLRRTLPDVARQVIRARELPDT